MEQIPKISVLMPVYNGEKYLREAIESILNQTEKDFEFLIIDDGSTDNSENIIRSYTDHRIKYHKRPHQGLVQTLNYGLSVAKGEYIARMDADDISQTERFEKQIQFMNSNQNVAICGTHAYTINDNGEIMGEMNYPPEKSSQIKMYAILHNPFIHSSILMRMKAIIDCGLYDLRFKHVEDYELWTRILSDHHGYNLKQKLIYYRMHENQVTSQMNFSMRARGVIVRFKYFVRWLTKVSR
jgi:glycosyltransferase involved in cell wall biosynthesis